MQSSHNSRLFSGGGGRVVVVVLGRHF